METPKPPGPASADSFHLSNYRWVILTMVFLATVLNYITRQTLSIVAPELRERYGIGDEGYGMIVSSFMIAYTIMNGISGVMIDKLGSKVGYAVIMAWWSLAGVAHALVRGVMGFAACRFLLGAGEAGNWPAGVKVVAEWFPPKDRALAGGIFNSGSAIGAIISPPLVVWLALHFGFKGVFVVTGLFGFVWLSVWWFVYRPHPGTPEVTAKNARPVPIWRLLRTKFVTMFALSNVCMDACWFFYVFWIPKFLSSKFNYTLAEIGKTAWIPFVTAGLGNLAGGFVTRWLINGGASVPKARKISCTIFACMMPSAFPAIMASDPKVAIAWISVATFGYCGFCTNGLAFPADVFPSRLSATVYGLAAMGTGIGGTVFGWLTGWMVQNYGYGPAFVTYGILPIIGLLIVLLFLGPLTPDPRFAEEEAPAR